MFYIYLLSLNSSHFSNVKTKLTLTVMWMYWVTSVCLTLCNPMAPLSMGLSRQEYYSGLPYPPPGDLPNPGIRPEPFKFPGLWSMGLQQVRQTEWLSTAHHWQADSLSLVQPYPIMFIPLLNNRQYKQVTTLLFLMIKLSIWIILLCIFIWLDILDPIHLKQGLIKCS